MAIVSVQRNALSPVPPLNVPDVLTELLSKWLPQLLDVTYRNRIDTASDVQVATGVSTPILILPTQPLDRGIWLATVNIGAVGDAINYSAAAVIATDGNTSRILQTWNAPLQLITLAGMTISSTQNSGGPQNLNATAIQLTHF